MSAPDRRVIVIVLDGCGAGAAPDASDFGDDHSPSTLLNTWTAVGGFDAPGLAACGFLAAGGIPNPAAPGAMYGRLQPMSKGGKDSVVGHWEMMGIVLDGPFPTYPDGFPIRLVKKFEAAIQRQTLGNRAASGTKIIQELGEQHLMTGCPILYTSADSVFQLAAHEDVVPVEQLYEWCRIARDLLTPPDAVQRVIARPFVGSLQAGFTRTERRRDFPMPPPSNFCDLVGDVYGVGVVPELFTGRGFRATRRTQSNAEHAAAMMEALASDARMIFANFEDTDMLYGHRNDPVGFARCLEAFDQTFAEVAAKLGPGDLLMLTADHGNDPTDQSTDHTREFAPLAVILEGSNKTRALGDKPGFSAVAATAATWLGLPWRSGESLV